MAESTTRRGVSRRSFIKGAAAFTAVGALAGCTAQTGPLSETGEDEASAQVPETQIFAGTCRAACMQGCLMNVHVRDGRVVRTTARDLPDPRYTRICSKGLTLPFRMYGTERLQYPMKRIGERGEGKFERISWDEAISTIAEKWQGYIDEFGPASLVKMTCGGNLGALPFSWTTLASIVGMTSIGTDFDAAHTSAISPMLGAGDMFRQQNENADLLNSKTIVSWGFNPAISHVQTMHFINEAREKGTRHIVIDPVFGPTMNFADWYIPVRAGTDAVLAMSTLGVVVENNWHDTEFLKAHTEAPFLVKEDGALLRMSDLGVEPQQGDPNPMTGEPTIIDPCVVWDEKAQGAVAYTDATDPRLLDVPAVNGMAVKTEWEITLESIKEYDPETAAGITGVSADDIRELARVYGEEGPVNTYNIYGFNHYFNAHQAYRAIDTLGFATGNIGKPGAATGSGNGEPYAMYNMVGIAAPTDSDGNLCANGSPVSPHIYMLLDVLETGKYLDQPYPLKSVVIATLNPLTTNTDRNYTIQWLNKFEFIIVADIVMTETAKYADILLPVAHWFEVTEAHWQSTNLPFVLWQDKVADPLYESKSDVEIVRLIAEALGHNNFPLLKNEDEFQKVLFDSDMLRQYGVTLDRLKEEKAVRHWTPDESELIAYKDLKFATPSGRISFYRETPYKMYDVGQEVDAVRERSLAWDPPKEAWVDSEVRKKFPFHCISERQRHRTHSQWQEVGCMCELYPRPVCKINPADATELGVQEGDVVKIFNDRGYAVVNALIHAGVPRKTITVSRGYEDDEFIEGHFANLTMKDYDNISRNQVFLDCAVGIERIGEGE